MGFPLHSKEAKWKVICKGITRFAPFFALTTKDKTKRLQCTEMFSIFLYRSEVPFQQTSVNKCSAHTGNLVPVPQREESTCKCLPQTGNATHPYPSLIRAALPSVPPRNVHRAVQRPELRSPLSFMSQMEVGVEMVSVSLKETLVCSLSYCQCPCCLLQVFPVAPLACLSGD